MSSETQIVIEDIGFHAILVDSGRNGMQLHGYSPSGPMDELAYKAADKLVTNSRDSVQIEFIGPLRFRTLSSLWVSVTGPDVTIQVANQYVDAWCQLHIPAGSLVHVEPAKMGQRHYIAIAGGIACEPVLGSATSVLREKVGGIDGEGTALRAGDRLNVNRVCYSSKQGPCEVTPVDYSLNAPIHVVQGYQASTFSCIAKRRFFSGRYILSNAADRMGYRLQGEPVNSSLNSMKSEGIALGAIQCPPDGQPIIMMRDRQTIGGYPKIGCVAPYDLHRLAQMVPGEAVTFESVNIETARANMLLINAGYQRLKNEFVGSE